MKFFAVTILFAILARCYGYSYLIPTSIKHPGICYYNGHMLTKGDNQMPTTCQNMRCNEDGSILVQGCGRIDIPKCTLLGLANMDKPYPDCCEMLYRCQDDDGRVFTKNWNQLRSQISYDSSEMNEELSDLDMTDRSNLHASTIQAGNTGLNRMDIESKMDREQDLEMRNEDIIAGNMRNKKQTTEDREESD